MAQFIRAALATRSAALSGSHIKAPGFAGGYLLIAPAVLRFAPGVQRRLQVSLEIDLRATAQFRLATPHPQSA